MPPVPAVGHILTLTWSGPYTAVDLQPYFVGGVAAPQINIVEWHLGGVQPPPLSGVYIIENAVGQPVYAGRATSVKGRFDGRNAALHDYRILAGAAMPTHRVWWAAVTSAPGWITRVARAEQWLVRYLYRYDQSLAPANRRLQNRQLLAAYPAPAGGMRVIWNNAGLVVPPAYLNNLPATVDYLAAPPGAPAGYIGYNHPAGGMVLV